MQARVVNVILGGWLILSAFLWPHTSAQAANTGIVGALCVAFSLLSTRAPNLRYLNTALSVWLFISAFAMPTMNIGTVWNNALAAVAIFIVSLAESEAEYRGKKTPLQPV